jgi:hypothetical protein
MNSAWNLFLRSDLFKSHQFGWRDLWMSHIICTGLSHADCYGVTDRVVLSDVDRVTPCYSAQLTKESCQPPWRESSAEYGSPPFFFPPLLFLSSFTSTHLSAASLTISSSLSKFKPLVWEIDSMSWYHNHVRYVCHLYHLILVYFKIFIWMQTHVVGIRDEINVFVISMYWLWCMNE